MTRNRGRVRGAAVALVLACLALPRLGAAAPPPVETRLARLSAEVAERTLALHVDDADPFGRRSRDADLLAVTQATLDSDRVFRRGALQTLADIERSAATLSPRQTIDLALLRFHLEREAIDLDERHRLDSDPGTVWQRLDRPVRVLLGRPGSLCRRLGTATHRLRKFPEALRSAEVMLDHPSRLGVETALIGFARTQAMLRERIPTDVRECREPGSVADLAEADTLAAFATDRFIVFLETELRPRADGEWAMGAERYARWLAASTGDTDSLASLRARAERELAASPAVNDPRVADSVRAAAADVMLEQRAEKAGRGSSRWLNTALARRDRALPWAAYSMRLSGVDAHAATGVPIEPTRLDLAAMLAEIDLHTGTATLDDARARLERDAGLDSASADAEVRRAALAPSRAVSTVTAWQLENLRAEVAGRLGATFTPHAFLTAVIQEGAIPVAAVRGSILRRLGVTTPAEAAR